MWLFACSKQLVSARHCNSYIISHLTFSLFNFNASDQHHLQNVSPLFTAPSRKMLWTLDFTEFNDVAVTFFSLLILSRPAETRRLRKFSDAQVAKGDKNAVGETAWRGRQEAGDPDLHSLQLATLIHANCTEAKVSLVLFWGQNWFPARCRATSWLLDRT